MRWISGLSPDRIEAMTRVLEILEWDDPAYKEPVCMFCHGVKPDHYMCRDEDDPTSTEEWPCAMAAALGRPVKPYEPPEPYDPTKDNAYEPREP